MTGDLRERARVPRPDLGAAADERDRRPRSSSRSSRSGRRSSASALAGDRLGVARLGGLRRDHGRDRRSPSRRAADVPRPARARPAARRMTAVLLALASAAAFGGDDGRDPARRSRDGGGARRGSLATLTVAFARHARRVARAARLHGRVEVLPRRPARAGLLAAPLHALDPARSAPRGRRSTVGTAPLFALAIAFTLPRRAGRGAARRSAALAIVAGGIAARGRARPARATCARAGLAVRARRGGALRGPRQHRPRAARARQPGDGRGGDDARRACSSALAWRAALPTAARARAASRRPGCCSGSRTCACSRRTSTGRVSVVSPLVATESLWGVGLAALVFRAAEGVGRAARARSRRDRGRAAC